ncbi:MAG: electron transfer flavoprotein subunit beta/FixA family protein [Actinomycetota bacterium]|nr:electron transfer flavoprotein subunit beta/FixA family protein [Actinomycetota bacterium]MDH5225332.1 electron transfer flavoprotein subunit beta/FixA family protein [Actinomycetota bacterium]MDH5314431.1 electron transfer flavoprotein subunit beta/FixA family protein [Actinomycetota bacterium]
MNVLVCVKRVPAPGSRITLTDDQLHIDTTYLGFTTSPHEECAAEEAVRLVEAHGGASVVLTLGLEAATEQLQSALAIGIDRAILLEADAEAWDAVATAGAIVDTVRAEEAAGTEFDLLMFGNEAADSADYQVGVRVAEALGLPCITGAKALEVLDGVLTAKRQVTGGTEVFDVGLPAVVTVREGINLPRFASVPGRIRAKKKEIARRHPADPTPVVETLRLRVPAVQQSETQHLGNGPDAAPAIVDLLERLGVVSR